MVRLSTLDRCSGRDRFGSGRHTLFTRGTNVAYRLLQICACAPAWKSLLQAPLTNLTYRLSSKLSSLRSPSNSRGTPGSSSNGKSAVFSPIRSLLWFQVTRLGFEKEDGLPSRHSTQELEKGPQWPIELAVHEHQIEVHADIGSRDFRHSEVVLEESMPVRPPTTPSLRIMKRQSLEQESAPVSQLTSTPRRSVGALLPGQWLGEGSPKKLQPRR